MVAFAVRVFALTRQSIWPDEAYSFAVSQWSLAEIVGSIRVDNVPLYTITLGWWQSVAGSNEFSLRFLSVLVAFLSVPLILVLGRLLVGPSAGVAAGLLLALSPFQVYFAQEVRMYGAVGTLSLLSSWLLLRYAENPPRRILVISALVYGALAYTHYSGLYVVGTHAAIVGLSNVIRSRRRLEENRFVGRVPQFSSHWAYAWFGGILLFAPWLFLLSGSLIRSLNGGTPHPLLELVQTALVDLSFGFNRLDVGSPVDASVLRHLNLASLVLLAGLGASLLPRRVGKNWGIPYHQWVAALHVIVPFASLIVLVQFTREFATRYAFPGTVWVPLLAVAGLWRLPLPIRGLGFAVLVGFGLWGTILYVEHPGFGRLDFRGAIADVLAHERAHDAVLLSPDVMLTYSYYREQAGGRLAPVSMPAEDPLDPTKTQSTLGELAAQHERLWRLRWQDYHYDPQRVVDRWLGAHAIREFSRDFDGGLGLELWLTRPPIQSTPPADATLSRSAIGDVVQLVAYQIDSDTPSTLAITFYWRLSSSMTDDYTVFIHLLGPDGHTIAQGDGPPYAGRFPTTSWPIGVLVRDVHRLTVNPCAPTGNYEIEAGFYTLRTMHRLGTPANDAIRLPVAIDPAASRIHVGRLLAILPAALRLDERLPVGAMSGC